MKTKYSLIQIFKIVKVWSDNANKSQFIILKYYGELC
jgi:hypothetical protein